MNPYRGRGITKNLSKQKCNLLGKVGMAGVGVLGEAGLAGAGVH